MADSGKNAITTLNGNGTALNLGVGFLFLEEAHVLVEVDDGGASGFDTLVLGTDYTINSATTVVTFLSSGPYGKFPPAGTDNVRFTRVTPHSALHVTFTEGKPLIADYFTQAFQQCLYYTEELEDQI